MVYAKEGFVLTKEIERILLCEFCSVRYESIIDYETLLDDELKCEGCFGIVGKSIKLSEKIITRLKKYEFDSFVIGCAVDKSLIKKDDELFNKYEKYIPLKNLIREEISKKITEELKIQENKEYPDITIIIDTKKNRFDLEIKSLYVLGKYNKFKRGIPQTKWPCGKCRGKGCQICNNTGQQYEKTVETLISPYLLKECEGLNTAFHGAGREDIDALMLGDGRPFVLEIKKPRIRSIDLTEAMFEMNINEEVKVSLLRLCEKSVISKIKTSSSESKKKYRAKVKIEGKITDNIVNKLNREFKEKTLLLQRTPLRVSHRRSDKVREKYIFEVCAELYDDKHIMLEIMASGGAYIKEFISGDEGRTTPSISSILERPAICIDLDVLYVDDKGLFS